MENYEKIHAAFAERLGYSEFYMRLHELRGDPWGSLTSRVIIDNAERHADEVVKLLIDYLDCMMEQIRREEPDTTTNYFTVTADGERMQFYAEELILDSDEPEWQRWLALRQRFLTGSQLEFESQYISGPGEKVYLGGDVPKLLEEPLKDGRLAKWVTLTVPFHDPFRCPAGDANQSAASTQRIPQRILLPHRTDAALGENVLHSGRPVSSSAATCLYWASSRFISLRILSTTISGPAMRRPSPSATTQPMNCWLTLTVTLTLKCDSSKCRRV